MSSELRSTSTATCPSSSGSLADFEAKYVEEERLGQGGFGTVFAGYRKDDHLPVAIKHINKFPYTTQCVDMETIQIPREVALQLRLRPAAGQTSAVVSLLDWYNLGDELILVLERPVPCMDLSKYIKSKNYSLQEDEAKIIMNQLLDGVHEIHSKGVFHRDLKLDNILIETGFKAPRARIIDFGQGTLINTTPKRLQRGWSAIEATNVWQLGMIAYRMLHKEEVAFFSSHQVCKEALEINKDLTDCCQNFLKKCLEKIPQYRVKLVALKVHPWLWAPWHQALQYNKELEVKTNTESKHILAKEELEKKLHAKRDVSQGLKTELNQLKQAHQDRQAIEKKMQELIAQMQTLQENLQENSKRRRNNCRKSRAKYPFQQGWNGTKIRSRLAHPYNLHIDTVPIRPRLKYI